MSAAHVQRDVRGWSCVLFMCLAWALDSRPAEQPVQTPKLDLRITAQPLDQALQEFARQSGVQVVYFSGVTRGLQSPGVSGKYTVPEALRKLLAGTGLSFRMLNASTVSIRKAEAGEPSQ